MGDKVSSEAAWQEEELSAAALPDKRLARAGCDGCWIRWQLDTSKNLPIPAVS